MSCVEMGESRPVISPSRGGRLVSIFLCGLLLSVCSPRVMAQEQTPSGLPGQTGATPPSPVAQLPPASATAVGASTQRFLEVRAFSNLSRITGEARDRSFLTDGNNQAVDFSYLDDFTLGARRMEVVSVLRYSDDRRVDPERNSVQRAYFRISGPRSEYNFGDYLVSYSRFTYNQNLKGLHFIQTAPWSYGFRLLGNAGTFTDRYGSLFKGWREDVAAREGRIEPGDLPGKPFTRVVSGLRLEQKIAPDKILAGNWAYGNDIVRSIPLDLDPATGTERFIPVENQVVSLDARMLFARVWNVEGEIAYSRTNPDTRFSAVHRKDYALRFDNSIRKGAGTFEVFYTRIMPSFLAINARQVADLQDILVRAGVSFSHVQLLALYRRTQDDLREQNRNPRTVFQTPEVRVTFRDLPGLGATVLDFGYRERYQDQGALTDRVTRTPFFEIGIPISSSVLTVGLEHRANQDRLNANNQTSTNDAWVAFRSIFDLGNWTFTSLARYQHSRELFDRVATWNNTRNLQGALTLDAPKYVSFDVLFRQLGATLFQDRPAIDLQTFQPLIGPNGLPSFEVVGPSGFRRPAFRFAMTFKFFNNADRFLTLSYEQNNNQFAVPGQDFLERVMQVTTVWRFRRQ